MAYSFKMDPKTDNQGVREIKRLLSRYKILPSHLAALLQVPPIRVSDILHGRRNITANTDLRLCKFFELPEGHFLVLQMKYDLAETKDEIAGKLAKIKPISQTALG